MVFQEAPRRTCLALAVCTLLLLPATLTGQVIVENSDWNFDNDGGTATNTIPGFTVADGSNRKLVVAINSNTAANIDSIEYGTGEFFTKAVDNGSTRLAEIWYLDSPSVGTADVVVTFSANSQSRAGVLSLQNAAPGPPVASSAVGGGTSILLTTPKADTFVVGCYIQDSGAGNPTGPTQFTNLYNGDSGSSNSDAGHGNEAAAGAKVFTWTNATTGGIAVAGFAAFDPTIVYAVKSDWSSDLNIGTNTNTIPDFQVGPGSDRKLVVSINGDWTTTNSVSISYGVQAFTLAEENSAKRTAQIWYLDDPAVGTADIVATLAENDGSLIGVVSLQNAAPGGPAASHSIAGGATSINLTVPPNTFVIGSFVQNGNAGTVVDPFSTTLYHADCLGSWGICGYQNEPLGGLKTYSYTNSLGAGIAVAGFVVPGAAPAAPPEVTAYSFDPSGTTSSTISFKGDISADYVLTSSSTLNDGFATTVTPTAVTVGSLLGDVITTDGTGNATVEFTETGTADFFRIEPAP